MAIIIILSYSHFVETTHRRKMYLDIPFIALTVSRLSQILTSEEDGGSRDCLLPGGFIVSLNC